MTALYNNWVPLKTPPLAALGARMQRVTDTKNAKYLDLLFFTGFAFLACHELDAVAQAEWRLLPFLNRLSDPDAYRWFVMLHVPLFALPLWGAASRTPRIRLWTQLGVDVFLVIHVGLHMAFHSNPLYTFHSTLSELCIFGAGAVGFVHFILAIRLSLP